MRIEPTELPPFQPIDRRRRRAPCATRSSRRTDLSRRARRSRPTTSTSASSATRRCPTSPRAFDYGLTGARRHAAAARRRLRSRDPATSSARRSAASARCSATCSANDVPELDGVAQHQLSARHQPAGGQPGARRGCRQTQTQTQLANQELQVATQVRERRGRCRPTRSASRRTRVVARARRAAARGRAAEVRGRHVHQLLRLPGAARPGAGAQQRAAGDPRLQPVGRRLRDGAGSAAWQRVAAVDSEPAHSLPATQHPY